MKLTPCFGAQILKQLYLKVSPTNTKDTVQILSAGRSIAAEKCKHQAFNENQDCVFKHYSFFGPMQKIKYLSQRCFAHLDFIQSKCLVCFKGY